eukprot:m.131283 g.131283  ORF g.131283 m.131283 type:complete len:618 (-) comp13748_c0_seq7:285-2138(-)
MRALIVTLVTGALCVSTGIANRVASHVHAPSTRHFRHVPNRSCYRLQVAQPSMRGRAGAPCTVIRSGQVQQGHRMAAVTPVVSTTALERELEPGPPGQEPRPAGVMHTVFAANRSMAYAALANRCSSMTESQESTPPPQQARADVVRVLQQSGPSKNRIDVVLMGDGYTETQQEQCFADMTRLQQDMFADITFRSYLPVFNIWAICLASAESGIGVNSQPRDTVFKLYRDGTQLRGIYCGDTRAAREACALVGEDGCDFPSMIGNDDYYGGLGGEFVIGTRSFTTGTVVLRHEMGHNFINVGEEYDGGQVYRGVNSASSVNNVGWTHWLSDPANVKEESADILLSEYPWHDLAKGPIQFTFTSSGNYARWFLRFTASGCEKNDAIRVTLDGQDLRWTSLGLLDRSFYTFDDMDQGFSAGSHTLKFEMRTPAKSGNPIRQLCSLTLHEYAAEPDFHFSNSWVSAYPTWSISGTKTFRPTNEMCLMRNMTSSVFCPVCQEGQWLQFFSKIELIDDVFTTQERDTVTVTVNVIQLGQFRTKPLPPRDSTDKIYGADRIDHMRIEWSLGGNHQRELDGRYSFAGPIDKLSGEWTVTVTFETDEVRYDPQKLLTSVHRFTVA